MKRVIRKSGFNDYVALDLMDDDNLIETSIYLPKNKPVELLGLYHEEKRWFRTEVIFDGEVIQCKDIDNRSPWHGQIYQLQIEDIKTELKPFHHQVRPGDTD